MRIEWTRRGRANAIAIAEYVADRDLAAALRQFDEIHDQVGRLAEHPFLGRQGRVEGTRELVINRTPYLVAYRVEQDAVVILRVLHGARDWPGSL